MPPNHRTFLCHFIPLLTFPISICCLPTLYFSFSSPSSLVSPVPLHSIFFSTFPVCINSLFLMSSITIAPIQIMSFSRSYWHVSILQTALAPSCMLPLQCSFVNSSLWVTLSSHPRPHPFRHPQEAVFHLANKAPGGHSCPCQSQRLGESCVGRCPLGATKWDRRGRSVGQSQTKLWFVKKQTNPLNKMCIHFSAFFVII